MIQLNDSTDGHFPKDPWQSCITLKATAANTYTHYHVLAIEYVKGLLYFKACRFAVVVPIRHFPSWGLSIEQHKVHVIIEKTIASAADCCYDVLSSPPDIVSLPLFQSGDHLCVFSLSGNLLSHWESNCVHQLPITVLSLYTGTQSITCWLKSTCLFQAN